MSSRQLYAFFFADLGEGLFSCKKCGCIRKQAAGTGYSHLIGHLSVKHAGYAIEFSDFQASSTTTIDTFGFVDETTSNIYQWMDWLIMRNLPLSEVENKVTRSVVKMKPVGVRTMKTYMRFVAAKVGVVLAAEMGDRFGLMFDGWSNNSLHFLGLYAVFLHNGERCQRLLALSPMDEGQSADAHIAHIECVLHLYGKKLSMVRFVVADNCSTNHSIATKLGLPLIGCASHRFNLGVNRLLDENRDQIDQIQNSMIQLHHTNNASELAKATDLKPIKANVTRWSSTYAMLKRYTVIRDAILTVGAVEEMVPRGAPHRRICALMEKLQELGSVCVKLQAEKRTMAEVRLLFDACVDKYPVLGEYLKPTAAIVHSQVFENAALKVQNDLPLSSTEQRAVLAFVMASSAASSTTVKDADFATAILRHAKKARRSERAAVQYDLFLRVIPPTSNACERLFSGCKLVLTSLRSSMVPANFETLMFLRANRALWNSMTLLGCVEE